MRPELRADQLQPTAVLAPLPLAGHADRMSEDPNAHRAMLLRLHARAVDWFGGAVVSERRFGWMDRTVGAAVLVDGVYRWLRLVAEPDEFPLLEFWTGNEAANVLTGVRRPRVLGSCEPTVTGWQCRAELMEFVPEPPCSPGPVAYAMPDVGPEWWRNLADSHRAVSIASTTRTAVDYEQLCGRLNDAYGLGWPSIRCWATAHGDLHWSNLTAPQGWWLDWEGWGLAPSGFDAASLYVHSLLVPELADKIGTLFADELNTTDGIVCQLYIADRMSRRGDRDNIDVDRAVTQHAGGLLLLISRR